VHRITGRGVHVVYDGIGETTWEEDFQVVRPKGTIVSFGNASGPVPPFAPLKLSPKALKVTRPTLAPFIAEPEDFARYATEIFDIVKKGALQVSKYIGIDPWGADAFRHQSTRSTPFQWRASLSHRLI
jgi:NADPH2:quinone reductase